MAKNRFGIPEPDVRTGGLIAARDLVPGTLLSSQKVARADTSILDLPVTILEFFGIEKPPQMVGRAIF